MPGFLSDPFLYRDRRTDATLDASRLSIDEEAPQGILVRRAVGTVEPTGTDPAAGRPAQASSPERTACGRVTAWREDKGFGFVATDDGDNVFVHVSKAGGTNLTVGTRVEIVYGPGEKSYVASRARPI